MRTKLISCSRVGFFAASNKRFLRRSRRSLSNFPSVVFLIVTASSFGLWHSLAQDTANTLPAVWTAPARAARKSNPFPVDQKSLAEGKELFTAACLPCHGASGRGDGPAASTLERNGVRVRPGNLSDPKIWQQADGAIFWKISEGNSPMPAFQESYSEEQRWQIVSYVRTLAPRAGMEITKAQK